MSLIAEQIEEVQGFAKEIDAGAINLIMDNLQLYQYEHPQKSAIRELVSNGLDAVKEKQIALSIISGKTKVEDHYLTRGDALNKDSNFDRGYYDLDWLWTPNKTWYKTLPGTQLVNADHADKVLVTYEEGGDTGKDRVIIEDFGVGMGGHRLEGYFKIGFSSKRNTKEVLGKFGIGAKAGLSTAPYYTMVSRYNGREYHFIVYPHNIQSIVPKLNMETGKENGIHVFSNGAIIYYRKTNMPNGVRVELESKKHHKQLYMDAVKSQLLYFPNVEFRVKNSAGGMDLIPVQAKIIYEDENILLSDNTQYSKPHILISRVNYGYVDFRELELEDVNGNIAFKMAAEDVIVKPSRESLVWNEVTRGAVIRVFEKIKATAEKMVSESLNETDFIVWLNACAQITTRHAADSIIGRISRLVDMSNAKVMFNGSKTIRYGINLFDGIRVRVNELAVEREGSVVKYHVKRKESGITMALADGLTIYVQQGNASFKIDKFLLQRTHKDRGFVTVIDPFFAVDDQGNVVRSKDCPSSEGVVDAAKTLLRYRLSRDYLTQEDMAKYGADAIAEVKDRMWQIMEHLMASRRVLWYKEVVVPDDFDAKEEVEDEQTIEQVKAKAEREKIKREKGVIPIFTPRNVESSYIGNKMPDDGFRLYEFQKLEMPVEDIDHWDEEEVFYSNDKDMELLHLAAALTRPKDDKLGWSPTIIDYKSTPEEKAAREELFKKYFNGYSSSGNGSLYSDPDFTKHKQFASHSHYTKTVATKEAYGVDWRDAARCHNFFETDGGKPKVKLIKVAQDRVKFFLDFKPIQRFFMDVKNKTLTMSNALIRWNTARVIREELDQLLFLNNFDRFMPKYAQWYRELRQYVNANFRDMKQATKDSKYYGLKEDAFDGLVTHLDKVTQFQLFVRDNADKPEKIAELATSMFNPKTEINNSLSIEIDLYDKLKELLDFAQPIRILLNEVNVLKMGGYEIREELEQEIRYYLDSKDINLSMTPRDLDNTHLDAAEGEAEGLPEAYDMPF